MRVPEPTAQSRARRRTTLLAMAGLALFQCAWILALIPYAGVDEFDHGYRASAVAAGHWQPGRTSLDPALARGELVTARADVVAAARPACAALPYTGPYNCHPYRDLGHGEVQVASAAGRYNPLYYAVVGGVAAPWHGNAHLLVMRATTAALCVLLFGLAVWIVTGFARTRWPLAALGLAALPTTVYSSSVAAPNGVTLFAGLALWCCLVEAVRAGPLGRRAAYPGAAVATLVLVNTHTTGALWLLLVLATTAVWLGARRLLRALRPRTRTETVWFLTAVLGGVFAAAWVLGSGVNDPGAADAGVTGSAWPSAIAGLVLWPLQAIATFPLRNQQAPTLVYALVMLLAGALLVAAARRLGLRDLRRSRTALAALGLLTASLAVPFVLTLRAYHDVGAAWQGRYGMPYTVGLFVIAGVVLDTGTPIAPRLERILIPSGCAALATAQLSSVLGLVARESGWKSEILATGWHAPSPLLTVALCVAAGLCWYAAAGTVRDRSGAPTPARARTRPIPLVLEAS